MVDVATLLNDGGWTVAESRRLRDRARTLRDEACAIVLTYRAHRFRVIRGGNDGEDGQRHRTILRAVAWYPAVKTFVGSSRGGLCAVCRGLIRLNDVEYDIEAGPWKVRIDVSCYRLFVEEMSDALRA